MFHSGIMALCSVSKGSQTMTVNLHPGSQTMTVNLIRVNILEPFY
jgi:hypothetical protein